ncbi:MAG: VCBS repeat-containing protein [Desulfomicrobium escambiense]|nr:VCBS repeat-containing protein [Desulfomicrobium escambiense]
MEGEPREHRTGTGARRCSGQGRLGPHHRQRMVRLDLDGDMDVFSANLAHPRYIVFSDRSMLLRNDGGRFTDVRAEMGIRYDETHSFPVWADFDSDGLPDLYITSVYPNRRSFLYMNTGNGFQDNTWLAGARVMDGWHVSAVDFDCDGRPDLSVNAGGLHDAACECGRGLTACRTPFPGYFTQLGRRTVLDPYIPPVNLRIHLRPGCGEARLPHS